MAELYVKYKDNLPSIRSNLSDANGYLNLASVDSVKFIHQLQSRITTPVTGSCTILGASSGYVEFTWSTGSPLSGGFYYGEFRINYTNGDTLTVPNDDLINFHISPKIS